MSIAFAVVAVCGGIVIEHKYRVPHVQHVPIEPHVAVAQVDGNGKITLWASSQSPFAQRNLIAKALHVSQADVQVIAPYVGGGFGPRPASQHGGADGGHGDAVPRAVR